MFSIGRNVGGIKSGMLFFRFASLYVEHSLRFYILLYCTPFIVHVFKFVLYFWYDWKSSPIVTALCVKSIPAVKQEVLLCPDGMF